MRTLEDIERDLEIAKKEEEPLLKHWVKRVISAANWKMN